MESRALEIEKRRRRQPLAELERKHLKALRRKGRLFTTEHLDYAFIWAEDLAQILSEAAERNAAAISPETFERTALREALPLTFSVTQLTESSRSRRRL